MVKPYQASFCEICGEGYLSFKEALDCESKGRYRLNVHRGETFILKNSRSSHNNTPSFVGAVVLGEKGFRESEHPAGFRCSTHTPLLYVVGFKGFFPEKAESILLYNICEQEAAYFDELTESEFTAVKQSLQKEFLEGGNFYPEYAGLAVKRGRKSRLCSELDILMSSLEIAVSREEFEKAAELRDRIDEQKRKNRLACSAQNPQSSY